MSDDPEQPADDEKPEVVSGQLDDDEVEPTEPEPEPTPEN